MTLKDPCVQIRPETAADRTAIHQVETAAFERSDEANLVDALRAEGYVVLSLVATIDDAVVGHLLLSRLPLHTKSGIIPLLAFAPIAISPPFQRQGIGGALIRESIRLMKEAGERAIVVLGHGDYYPQFGFSAALAKPLKSPFSGDIWMACELTPGSLQGLKGRVQYPPPFGC